MSIDTLYNAVLDWCAQCPEDVEPYALVDIALCPPSLTQSLTNAKGVPLFDTTPYASQPALSPWLLPLAKTDTPPWWLKSLCAYDIKEPCVHWLSTREKQHDLIARLRYLLQGRLQDNRTFLLRYYDRVLWPFVVGQLTPEQQRWFIDPIHTWATWSSEQGWQDCKGALTAQDNALPSEALLWAPEQIFKLELAALPYQLWEEFQDLRPELLLGVAQDTWLDRWRREVLLAHETWGLKRYQDFLMYALTSATVHPQFDQHPEVTQALSLVKSEGLSVSDALERIPEAVWNTLKPEPAESAL